VHYCGGFAGGPTFRGSSAFARHVAVANALATNWAFESLAPREEAGVVNAPHKFNLCVN
jgi:hypothetical protein